MVLEVVVGRSAMTHDIAAQLGLNQAVKLLETTLGEEKKDRRNVHQARSEQGSTGTRRRRDADAGGGIEGHPHRVRIVTASAASICSVYRA
jgi:hypothetical protein